MQQNINVNNYSTNKNTIFQVLRLFIKYESGKILLGDYSDFRIKYDIQNITNYFLISCHYINEQIKNELTKVLGNHIAIMATNDHALFLTNTTKQIYNAYICRNTSHIYRDMCADFYDEHKQFMEIEELEKPCIISMTKIYQEHLGNRLDGYNLECIPWTKKRITIYTRQYYIISKKGLLTKCATCKK